MRKIKTPVKLFAGANHAQKLRNMLHRIEALNEAADHLTTGTWTLIKGEEEQGIKLAAELRKEAQQLHNKVYEDPLMNPRMYGHDE